MQNSKREQKQSQGFPSKLQTSHRRGVSTASFGSPAGSLKLSPPILEETASSPNFSRNNRSSNNNSNDLKSSKSEMAKMKLEQQEIDNETLRVDQSCSNYSSLSDIDYNLTSPASASDSTTDASVSDKKYSSAPNLSNSSEDDKTFTSSNWPSATDPHRPQTGAYNTCISKLYDRPGGHSRVVSFSDTINARTFHTDSPPCRKRQRSHQQQQHVGIGKIHELFASHGLKKSASGPLAKRSKDDYELTVSNNEGCVHVSASADDLSGRADIAKMIKGILKQSTPMSMSADNLTTIITGYDKAEQAEFQAEDAGGHLGDDESDGKSALDSGFVSTESKLAVNLSDMKDKDDDGVEQEAAQQQEGLREWKKKKIRQWQSRNIPKAVLAAEKSKFDPLSSVIRRLSALSTKSDD